jgi:hypothetical protein
MFATMAPWHMVKPYKVSPKLQNLLWSIGSIFHGSFNPVGCDGHKW